MTKKIYANREQRSTLVLMACSATKLSTEAELFDLYTGPLWQTLRTHLPADIDRHDVWVLSGKHGFRSSSTWCDPYEGRISEQLVDYLIRLGVTCIPAEDRQRDLGCQNIASRMPPWGRQWSRVVICGAGHYRRFFLWLVEQLKGDLQAVLPDAPVLVCDGAGIGYQRQQLATFLQAEQQQVAA